MELLDHWAQAANIALGLSLHSRGILEYITIIAPVGIGTIYMLVKWAYFKLSTVSPNPFYDPRVSRAWYVIAILNVLVLAPFGWVPVSVGVFLLVSILYVCNNDFGTRF